MQRWIRRRALCGVCPAVLPLAPSALRHRHPSFYSQDRPCGPCLRARDMQEKGIQRRALGRRAAPLPCDTGITRPAARSTSVGLHFYPYNFIRPAPPLSQVKQRGRALEAAHGPVGDPTYSPIRHGMVCTLGRPLHSFAGTRPLKPGPRMGHGGDPLCAVVRVSGQGLRMAKTHRLHRGGTWQARRCA